MSKRIGKVIIISTEKPQQCDGCGKIDELRPYGHKGACICPTCAEKIPEIVRHNVGIVLFGDEGELL